MTDDHTTHPQYVKRQRLIAAMCIGVLSIMYLVGAIQWERISFPGRTVANAQIAALKPPFIPARLAYAPDAPPAEPRSGVAPVITKIDTKQPVVFLTIDDGFFQEPEAAERLKQAGVPASLFLTQQYVAHAPGYFSNIVQQTGSAIQNHTMRHKDLTSLTFDEQRVEICGASNNYSEVYGSRPSLFRPPYGLFNHDTQRIVAVCGMQAVVLWSSLVEHGVMYYQDTDQLHAGDIVLMHFTPAFKQDLEAFVAASKAANLQPQLLENWLTP